MPRDRRVYLWDVISYGTKASELVEGKSYADHETDEILMLALERVIFIIGEAVVQLKADDTALTNELGPISAIVATRNVLAHGYFRVDRERLWEVATVHVTDLVAKAKVQLDALS